MGSLTTHVLDTVSGEPAAGLRLELFSIADDTKIFITHQTTNGDGRCDQPLAEAEQFLVGTYQIEFHVGDYFNKKNKRSETSSFLKIVPIQFSNTNVDENYHVPLLVSPFSYSTYRGS